MKNRLTIFSIFVIFLLFLLYNFKLISNLSTALIDWLDYPLVVFIIQQNVKHLVSLDFSNLFNLANYFPSPNNLFFTDTFFVQSVIGVFLYPFTRNFILIHNLIWTLTAFVNIIALHFFWGKIFKHKIVASSLVLLATFSPFYFSQFMHHQMLAYAPFFFSAGILLTASKPKHYLVAGFVAGLQFLASVYLGVFSLFFCGLFLLWKLITEKKFMKVLRVGLTYLGGFMLIAGFFVYKYAQVKDQYQIARYPQEYVEQAIQPTDIIFNNYPSLLVKNVYGLVNQFNKHQVENFYSVGFVLLFLATFGLWLEFKSSRRGKQPYFLLMGMILSWGIIASLGPRLTLNGQYLGWPLPYLGVMKLLPFLEAIRGTSRWFFLTQIGLLFFVGHTFVWIFEKVQGKKSLILMGLILLLYSLELLPLEQRTETKTYRFEADAILSEQCRENDVLLQYPFSPQWAYADIKISLNYWVEMQLNSMDTKCWLVNGYSGFDPEHFVEFRQQYEEAMKDNDRAQILKLLGQKEVTYLKINKQMLGKYLDQINNLKEEPWFAIVFENQDFLVAKVSN